VVAAAVLAQEVLMLALVMEVLVETVTPHQLLVVLLRLQAAVAAVEAIANLAALAVQVVAEMAQQLKVRLAHPEALIQAAAVVVLH
jgi:hypothetical protein